MSKPQIVGWEINGRLFVRFQNVRRDRFDRLLTEFRGALETMVAWDKDQGAWQLPLSAIQQVAVFAEHHLGNQSFQYLGAKHVQLRLF